MLKEHNKVITYIVEEMDAGRLIEGSRLPAERELSEKIGTNRNTTREAICILRGMGLVESRPGSGNYIVNNAATSIKQMVSFMLKMKSISVKEIIDYRRFISKAIGTELIENGISPENQKYLEDIIKAMKDASVEDFIKLDVDFHLSLLNATENRLFMRVMEPVGELYMDIVSNVVLSSTHAEMEKLTGMHEEILKSILNKDAMACTRAMRAHYDMVESKFDL